MFSLLRRKVTAEAPTPAVEPATIMAVKPLNDTDLESYLALAAEIGLQSAATVEARLLNAIVNEQMSLYDLDSVSNYMDERYVKTGWVWFPLRTLDVNRVQTLNIPFRPIGYQSVGGVTMRQYTQAVPRPVLERIATLNKLVPHLVYLVAAENTSVNGAVGGDPFLGVTCPGMRIYVIERWDEPSFRR